MDYRGPDLKADLTTIWRIATEGFPKMAESYRSANAAVHLTYTNTGFDAEFIANWRAFRDHCEMVLGRDARTLDDTAFALSQAVVAYAAEDATAADAISEAGIDLTDEAPRIEDPLYPVAFQPAGETSAPPPRPDYDYTEDAPTKEALIEKAKLVDDKLYEANYAETNMFAQPFVSAAEFLGIDTVGGDGYVFTVDKLKSLALDNPGSYQGAVGSLEAVVIDGGNGPFGQFMTEVNHVSRALNPDNWDSEAARAFAENFIDTYEDTVATQKTMLGSLHGAISGYQKALADTYRAYDEIMDATINACIAIIQSEEQKDIEVGLAVLGAAVSVGSSVSDASTLAFSLAESAISIASTDVKVGEISWDGNTEVAGSRTGIVRHNLFKALDKAHSQLVKLDTELTRSMSKDCDLVMTKSSEASSHLQLARPDFADNPAAL